MNAILRRGACPALSLPMQTGDGLLVRLSPLSGGVTPAALVGLCGSARRHGNGIMEVTQRGSIQIRGLTPASARQLAGEVNALGIAVRSGVPVETGPLAGIDPDEVADPRPLAEAIRAALESAGLPGRLGPKVTVIVDGGGRVAMDALLADVKLTAVQANGEPLWRMSVGGDASATRALGLVGQTEAIVAAVRVLEAVAELGLHARARDLDHSSLNRIIGTLVREDQQGPASIRSIQAGQPLLGIHTLANGSSALSVALPFGSMPADAIAELARQAVELGAIEIRPAPRRAMLVLGLSPDAGSLLQGSAVKLGFVTDAGDPRLHVVACPGRPACGSGLVETRTLAEGFARQYASLFDGSVTVHVSGCAKGCAHPGTATLTLVGDNNGVGLVANGTARSRPVGYIAAEDISGAFERIAALVEKERRSNETAAACLTRIGMLAAQTFTTQEQD